ncbi:MAG: hypothetical protein QOF87_2224 [Pseudonocardiales bacterium]|jgi:hypothetical protein|nr:hypothetical protein [Pseudonocardiales bacterium]MDT4956435.1 hypothetical protein [Pseudonocardiales bacterium]MDT4962577.1 hypothetical protein [Pseudonocardiales bacterium]MDT4977870.1 hypothetical protein [Pseudonocardiales bacterium]MDT4982121.1 hypothetical protein [Pseudonocardiales bacterium]
MSTESHRSSELSAAASRSVQMLPSNDCSHEPHCPGAYDVDHGAARVVSCHPEQGWSLLCNGVVLFDDTGEILPDGHCTHARRADLTAAALHRAA